ncbi:hypothetical protein I7G00_12665 [Sinorhizobium meliloti]|uniref:hypothetical protein n=1 Tax=Rhizobium meliloti TaxID=382 RepID=UPI000FD322FD|nr:hypothetical protein [Sinorhizobium meliloti]MDE3784897.1 hypothetical protein [Sinorhizobium meliloti]MDX0249802.1 hypothetical protein [Sinorhizobium meliloti]RVI11103.1 hypothetical protein CN206_15365 [Sinorhizobium meliloti]
MKERDFQPGDKVAWLMPMDIYEGIVVRLRAGMVEVKPVIGFDDEQSQDSEFIAVERLTLVRRSAHAKADR